MIKLMVALFTYLSRSRRSELLHEVNMASRELYIFETRLSELDLCRPCITWMLCGERKNNGQERLIAEIMHAIKFLATIGLEIVKIV